uniref:Uncharacterized protein n=1 Tax=Chromera velia CCMP2878 TaxID=1169474 RepID=A0A0G4F3N3_9ALVE|eukprot:Cvel_14906.t1-p1 / transcript=Cvel_14906.t1 / gene=Cvel_14906 / organism=Chromera_velia_CCMP2878 / gene_product=hypothetical protein / transcript_product=hypothetical protein / location=Cvel_scaffold1080:19378-22733(-) / protein_length=106 / sequence_SO=supercontig / SO=protein_coding / is_pseudo=false
MRPEDVINSVKHLTTEGAEDTQKGQQADLRIAIVLSPKEYAEVERRKREKVRVENVLQALSSFGSGEMPPASSTPCLLPSEGQQRINYPPGIATPSGSTTASQSAL